jgi:hypothetical protein
MRWFALAVVVVTTIFLCGACGGESANKASSESAEVEEVQEPANVEEVQEKEATLDCQLDKAEANLGPAGTEELMTEWHMQEVEPRVEDDLGSAVVGAKDLSTFLAERGYVC